MTEKKGIPCAIWKPVKEQLNQSQTDGDKHFDLLFTHQKISKKQEVLQMLGAVFELQHENVVLVPQKQHSH